MLKIKILTKNLNEELTHTYYKQEHKFKGYELGISFNFAGAKNSFYHLIPVSKEFYESVQVNEEIELVPKLDLTIDVVEPTTVPES